MPLDEPPPPPTRTSPTPSAGRPIRRWGIRLIAGMATVWLSVGPASAADEPGGPLALEPEAVRPGLIAVYRPLGADGPALHRVDPKPAFTLGASSPHPRIPAGPFEVAWRGILHLQDPGPIAFEARLGGELEMEVDGVAVLRGAGRSDASRVGPSEPLTRPPGHYRLSIRYRSLAGVPARLQVFWAGPTFAPQPLPAWRLAHLAAEAPPELARDERVARGRDAAGRLGCARCHQGALPGVTDPPPGPSLADARRRLRRDWLLRWLDGPSQVKPGARMPALFRPGRAGLVERWVLADFLSGTDGERREGRPPGDHRAGRRAFLGLGCAACHLVPDLPRAEPGDPERVPLDALGDRLGADDLAAFLGNPHARYPDGRMPRLPVVPEVARDIAAYLLLWSGPSPVADAAGAPTAEEVRDLARRLGTPGRNPAAAAAALLVEKGCASCHPGLGSSLPVDRPIREAGPTGCLADHATKAPRFALDAPTRDDLIAYLAVAAQEKHPSPFDDRRRRLARAGCVRCHQRDGDRPPPIEELGRSLGGANLTALPYQRTPRLTNPHQKLERRYLSAAVREGVASLRGPVYTYRMPAYGADAEVLVAALAEADGEPTVESDPPSRPVGDPTLATLAGPELVGSRGYGCISCHVWAGRQLAHQDPGAVGPDLTRLVGRVRRDWFDGFLDDPTRHYPGTPMPAIFRRGQKASLMAVLDGDPARQKDALWAYFALGPDAPAPQPPPPLPIAAPAPGEPPLVAQIPIRLPDGQVVEALCLLTADHDLVVYDMAEGTPRAAFVGGRILRTVEARTRRFLADGTPAGLDLAPASAWRLADRGAAEAPAERILHGYDRLPDGARVRTRVRFPGAAVEVEETLRVVRDGSAGRLERHVRLTGVPAGAEVRIGSTGPSARLIPDRDGTATALVRSELPPRRPAPAWEGSPRVNPDPDVGSLERPGYRAYAYPRPKTVSGEDRVMPAALAIRPRDGRLFVASLKTGELFVLDDPRGDPASARFRDYARGLFQDAYSMLAEGDDLDVLHRRNLTRVVDTDGDGEADRFDRVAALPHGVADTYDYAYGLARDRRGGFLVSYAPYANTAMPGSGGVVRLVPGEPPREIALGLRNPLGWCAGQGGEVFFTDNQGEWVAANKLGHLEEGRFYGFPNPARGGSAGRPLARPVAWIPYGWARSINGVAYDDTGGKFGPFAGQLFLAELMFGGAIVRVSVERVNGQYQGACFPFWGKGLLGPVSLAFDPRGHLYVGGITEPGWMAQPDRGALFRIDFTGPTPFEIRSIHARPRGFRVELTKAADRRTAADPASYRLERYRYEYTGAYGSPELDRSKVGVERADVSADGLSVDLTTAPLIKDRVYLLEAAGVRSADGEVLVHPAGAYTLNEIPDE